MNKKKTQEECSSSSKPSGSSQKSSVSQKSSKPVKVSNYLDDYDLMKTIKKRPRDRRSMLSISKMSQLSQSMSQGSSQSQSSLTRSPESPDFSFKKPKKKERSNMKSLVNQPKLRKYVKDKEKKKNEELALTIDELLTLPEKPDDVEE